MTEYEARVAEREALVVRIDAALDPARPLTETSEDRAEVVPLLRDARAFLAWKHPDPEITDDMVRRGALAMCRMDWKISMGGATTLVKAALEAALRVPAGEADVPR